MTEAGDAIFRYSARSYESTLPRPSAGAPTGTPSSDRFSGRYGIVNADVGRGSAPNRGGTPVQQGGFGGWGFLGYVQEPVAHRTWGVAASGPEWDDSLVLSETHYHHGDHHHNHHQRHIHHFHDLHLLGSAEEVLDLRGAPAVRTKVIPSDTAGNGPQMTLRPDVLGRQAFEAGADQYFSSLSSRFDMLSRGSGGGGATGPSASSMGGGFSGFGVGVGGAVPTSVPVAPAPMSPSTHAATGLGPQGDPSVAFTAASTTSTNIQRTTNPPSN